ncbi:MAG: hypothetical protein AMJ67_10985 [Betaproteobacteria bacterium SG8_41]|jgi:hypothetical protein|nr:MAG: hypothetical protein AMJ67_10985 [Betaproteobacteria bacterium SG8_41]
MMDKRLRIPLICVLIWLAGAVLWNVAGVILIAKTGTGIGPTASLTLAGIMGVVAVLLYLAARFNRIGFAILSALCALAAFAAVYQAFTGEASLWSTPFWRWAGAALNLFGFGAGLWGLLGGIRSRRVATGAKT